MVQINSVSKPEAVKQQSRQLRGHIARDLADTTVPFDKEGYSRLKSAIAEINAALLTTLAACGDVVRTVTTTPAPIRDPVHDRVEAETLRLSSYLLPRTRAYHEIWVDGAPWRENEGASDDPDPLYGERYLPRKFKIGLAIPEDNTID